MCKEIRVLDKVVIIGVYPVQGNKDVYLIEVAVDAQPSEFDVGEFMQENPSLPRDNWQVAWNEHYLNEAGDRVIGDYFDQPSAGVGITRLVFYLFEVDFERPLLTPFGPVPLPKPTPLPERLKKIIHFIEPD